MIRVVVYGSGASMVDVQVDADDAAIVGPDKLTGGEDLLVLEKDHEEVAWFKSWAYAIKEPTNVS